MRFYANIYDSRTTWHTDRSKAQAEARDNGKVIKPAIPIDIEPNKAGILEALQRYCVGGATLSDTPNDTERQPEASSDTCGGCYAHRAIDSTGLCETCRREAIKGNIDLVFCTDCNEEIPACTEA